jgi:hypothetical protein
MEPKHLIELRRAAEKAVSDMPEGELKVKAFEVILNNLLHTPENGRDGPEGTATARPHPAKEQQKKRVGVPTSTPDRILQLKEENYFHDRRSISDVRQELATHGWHYPLTTLSGTLQDLVQRRELRRQKVIDGKRKTWKYSNP